MNPLAPVTRQTSSHDGSTVRPWTVVRDIATATVGRRAAHDGPAVDGAPVRGRPVDPSCDDVCLVTGASGFIGGHLARRLTEEGYQVRCLVRASSDTGLLDKLDVEIATGDLTSAASLARATEGCRYVFHCGALVSDWAAPKEIARVNVEGTRKLLKASVDAQVRRFIHFSSTDVYGYPGGAAIDETHVGTRFRNWYAQTKLDAEAEVRAVEKADGLDAVIMRPATVYGPRSVDVIGAIARAIRDGNMVLVGGGRAIAGLCYVDNLMDAAVLALHHEAARGQAFNATDGLDITWKEFTDGLAEGLGYSQVRWSLPYWLASGTAFSVEHAYRLWLKSTGLTTRPLLSRQAVHVMGKDQDFSNRKARELLHWEPTTDYATGLAATVAWLRAEGISAI